VACLRIMKESLRFKMGGFDSPILGYQAAKLKVAEDISYACCFFAFHVQNSDKTFQMVNYGSEIDSFLKDNILFWLEAVALSSSSINKALRQLGDILKKNGPSQELVGFLKDAQKISDALGTTPLIIFTFVIPILQSRWPSFLANQCRVLPSIYLHGSARALPGHYQYPNWRYAISPQGNWIAIDMFNALSMCSVLSGALVWSMESKSGWRRAYYFSQDEQILFACSSSDDHHLVEFLDVPTSTKLRKELTFRDPGIISNISLSPQCMNICVALTWNSTDFRIIQMEDDKDVWQGVTQESGSVLYLPDGRLARIHTDAGCQHAEGSTGEILDLFLTPLCFYSACVSRDGSLLAVSGNGGPRITIWNITALPPILVATLGEHDHVVEAMCFSEDANLFVSGSVDETVRVWQQSSQGEKMGWECIAVLYGHWGGVDNVAFLHNAKQVLSGSKKDGTIRIWDISAAVEAKETNFRVKDGVLANPGWPKHGILLGGWLNGKPFKCEYPGLQLLPDVKGLNWDIKTDPIKLDEPVPGIESSESEVESSGSEVDSLGSEVESR